MIDKTNKVIEMTPNRIRAIRESLGLTQAEAGKYIGGGPRGFTKYEAGTTTPSASVVNFLKVLEDNPSAIHSITGTEDNSLSGATTSPFSTEGKHIEDLDAKQLVALATRLLCAEAISNGIYADGLHVAENINTSDGGEDARLEWQDGPDRTRFLRGRLNQLQLKSGPLTSQRAADELFEKSGEVKHMVKQVLESGGFYYLLCGKTYNQEQINERRDRINQALAASGINYEPRQIAFLDAKKIADWVNTHPSVAVWLLEITQSRATGEFRSWAHWRDSKEHSIPLAEDPRLDELRGKLIPIMCQPQEVRRIAGPSGVGKSRLVLESFNRTSNQPKPTASLSDLVLYVDEQVIGEHGVKLAIQNLADSNTRAIIAVDRCTFQTYADIKNIASRPKSKISLIAITDEPPYEDKLESIKIPKAEDGVITAILKSIAPNLADDDIRRLTRHSQGFPKFATLLGQSWANDEPISRLQEDIARTIVAGRDQSVADLLVRGAQILSIFGMVYDGHLEHIAKLGRNLSTEDLRSVIRNLEQRDIVQRKGRAYVIQPRPITLTLAEIQWEEWGKDNWDRIITADIPEYLKEKAAKQLALLNTSEIGEEIGRHLLRYDGPLSNIEKLSTSPNTDILSSLCEIDPAAAFDLLEYVYGEMERDELAKVDGNQRRAIVRSLEIICFNPDTFEQCALLLMQFALAEDENWSNNATGQFTSMFPVRLGNTAADGTRRLRVIDEALDTEDLRQLTLALDALLAGARTDHFSRGVGAEHHGLRPALKSWTPSTWGDFWDYVRAFYRRLITLARRDDAIGEKARIKLGQQMRSLVISGLFEIIDEAIEALKEEGKLPWPEALESLAHALKYDAKGRFESNRDKIIAYIDLIKPTALADKVNLLILNMPWDYPSDEKLSYSEMEERKVEDIGKLIIELLADEDQLKSFIEQFCRIPKKNSNNQRLTSLFGKLLAEKSREPRKWADITIAYLSQTPKEERDFGVLAGIARSMDETEPSSAAQLKEEISQSDDIVAAFPFLASSTDLYPKDIELAVKLLREDRLKPAAFHCWSYGGVTRNLQPAELSPLLDELLTREGQAIPTASHLIGMYGHSKSERFEGLKPQIEKLARKAPSSNEKGFDGTMDEHHFETIMTWALSKGREDKFARSIALALTKHLINQDAIRSGHSTSTLLKLLLKDFPDISWPLISQSILSSDDMAKWHLQHLLGDSPSFDGGYDAPILSIPEDLLFAWCEANPKTAPAFVAICVPVLSSQKPEDKNRTFHPIMQRVIDEFASEPKVLDRIAQNIGTYGWSGSRSSYYALYEEPFKLILHHENIKVRRWASKMVKSLGLQKDGARQEDEEQDAYWG